MRLILSAAALLLSATIATAEGKLYVQCGGGFNGFISKMKAEAARQGFNNSSINSFFAAADKSQKVLNADRRQGIFKTNFVDFSRKLISQNRIDNGRANANRYNSIFNRIEAEFGQDALVVSCPVAEFEHRVYIASDPDIMNNHGLALGDNASFATALLKAFSADDDQPVYIDRSPDLLTSLDRDDERQDYERDMTEFKRFFEYPFTLFWAALLIILASVSPSPKFR